MNPETPRARYLYRFPNGVRFPWPMTIPESVVFVFAVVGVLVVFIGGALAISARVFPDQTPLRLLPPVLGFVAMALVMRWTVARIPAPADLQERLRAVADADEGAR